MGRVQQAWRALTNRDLASDQIGWQLRGSRGGTGTASVTQETALRHSAWWACLRLRADLISTTPVDSFRERDGRQIEVTKPPLLVTPAPGVDITEHMYSSQFDLDRYGNSVGIITGRNSFGLPATIELAPMSEVSARMNGHRLVEWRICNEKYLPEEIWHEKQFTVGGMPLGLSPLAYAAWTIGGYLSAQQFALDWFTNGAQPSGVLRNTEQTVVKDIATVAKASFKAATENRDIFVTGKDWEWTPAATDAASTGFLEQQSAGILDVCRYLGVPGDMIDASNSTGNITYANVTQRNVQLLVINLGPAYVRRERKWSMALPAPRFVKFNTDALLRMDPETRQRTILARVAGKTLAPSEARALDNVDPFTDEQLAEIAFFAQMARPVTPTTQQAAQVAPWEVPA
jgi:HK97 family phage portal protein